MVSKNYDWEHGAKLEDHTRKKHEILRRYFREYLITRCKFPQQEKFRLAIIDGFSGAGLYECGSYGSPLIFVDVLINTAVEINTERYNQGLKPLVIECLLQLNDRDTNALEQLKESLSPLVIEAESSPHVQLKAEYHSSDFQEIYPTIKRRLKEARYSNVFFNLDQCGYKHAPTSLIRDIVASWKSAEVILTFMIKTILTFLSPNSTTNQVPLEPDIQKDINLLLSGQDNLMSKQEWLARAEKVVFEALKNCATFVSPFAINNPDGWQYWLMHFANNHRARQVYNNVLHQCDAQAHYGRAGLHMLSYDPANEGKLYLFDANSRDASKNDLYDDIPRFIAEAGDALSMHEFYEAAYSETPAHSEDIHEMIIENEDIEVITDSGGSRRKPNAIKPTDTLKLKVQPTFFPLFKKGG
ncbi:MAG: three-Cys-motif partner protein TcmP [Sedimenticola sp.]